MNPVEQEIEASLARSNFYRFFALAFRYPSKQMMREIHEMRFRQELGEAGSFLGRLSPETLESEFAKTFGHSVGGNAPAYEMEYGDPESFWGPHEMADIGAFYRSFGVKVGSANPERLDHISVECEFMCFLLFRLAYALGEGHDFEKIQLIRDGIKKFYEDHIGRWGFAFSRRLEKSTQSDFYRTLARLLGDFLEGEGKKMEARMGSRELKLRTVNFEGADEVEEACRSCNIYDRTI